jgi:hypothetical protein
MGMRYGSGVSSAGRRALDKAAGWSYAGAKSLELTNSLHYFRPQGSAWPLRALRRLHLDFVVARANWYPYRCGQHRATLHIHPG